MGEAIGNSGALPRGIFTCGKVAAHFIVVQQSKDLIEDLLDRIPRLWENNKSLETCFGPALCAGAKILGPIGGKLVMVLSEMPSFGVGRLHNRCADACAYSPGCFLNASVCSWGATAYPRKLQKGTIADGGR